MGEVVRIRVRESASWLAVNANSWLPATTTSKKPLIPRSGYEQRESYGIEMGTSHESEFLVLEGYGQERSLAGEGSSKSAASSNGYQDAA